jgi:SNF2 family DNA or RNA helicase
MLCREVQTVSVVQNDLMELWSLMHFLMPHIFHSHAQFQGWFSNPLTGMVEGAAAVNSALVSRLHAVLRPFMLRRLKQVLFPHPSAKLSLAACGYQ